MQSTSGLVCRFKASIASCTMISLPGVTLVCNSMAKDPVSSFMRAFVRLAFFDFSLFFAEASAKNKEKSKNASRTTAHAKEETGSLAIELQTRVTPPAIPGSGLGLGRPEPFAHSHKYVKQLGGERDLQSSGELCVGPDSIHQQSRSRLLG